MNKKIFFLPPLTAIIIAFVSNTLADDLNTKLIKTSPVGAQAASPTIQPVDGPTSNPAGALTNKLPYNSKIQKDPATLPANRDLQLAKPVNATSAVQTIQISNQKWEDVQNLPESTVLVGNNGERKTLGELKKIKRDLATRQNFTPTLSKKEIKLKSKSKNNLLVDTKSILKTENAAAINAQSIAIKTNLECTEQGCINSVNGKSGSRVIFTPGTDESAAKYTISGNGFGATQGNVYLSGGFNKRPTLRVDNWRDDQITAYFEKGFTGEQDRNDVKLVVKLPNGKMFESLGNAKFYAARAQTVIDLSKIPDSRLTIEDTPNLRLEKTANHYEFKNKERIINSNGMHRTYTDKINVTPNGWLKPGFEAVYAEANIEQYNEGAKYVSENGCSGSTHTFGESNIAWLDENTLQILRPINQISIDPFNPNSVPDRAANTAIAFISLGLAGKIDINCTSLERLNYYHAKIWDIKVVVEGPAGVSPF